MNPARDPFGKAILCQARECARRPIDLFPRLDGVSPSRVGGIISRVHKVDSIR